MWSGTSNTRPSTGRIFRASPVVQVHCSSLLNQDNSYGQVPFCMYMWWTVAVCNWFGPLTYGQKSVARLVLQLCCVGKGPNKPLEELERILQDSPSGVPCKQPIFKVAVILDPLLELGRRLRRTTAFFQLQVTDQCLQ